LVTRHQIAGAPRLVIPERHLLQAREERVANVVLDVAGCADQDQPHQVTEDGADAGDAEQHAGIEGELGAGDAGGQVVDREFQHPRRQQLNGRGDDHADETEDELAAVAVDEGKKAAERGDHLP